MGVFPLTFTRNYFKAKLLSVGRDISILMSDCTKANSHRPAYAEENWHRWKVFTSIRGVLEIGESRLFQPDNFERVFPLIPLKGTSVFARGEFYAHSANGTGAVTRTRLSTIFSHLLRQDLLHSCGAGLARESLKSATIYYSEICTFDRTTAVKYPPRREFIAGGRTRFRVRAIFNAIFNSLPIHVQLNTNDVISSHESVVVC